MPKFSVIKGPLKDQVFDLGERDIIFCGRSPKMNDIAILEIAISRKHFKVFKIGGEYFIEDLNSKHGTLVNGNPIEPGEGFQIGEGDIIAAGNTVMQFSTSGGSSLFKAPPVSISNPQDASLSEEPRKERRSAKELELVFEISELLKKQLDTDVFLKEFLKLVLEALPRVDNASIFLFQEKTFNWRKTLEIVPDTHEKTVSRYKKELVGRVFEEQKTIRMSNTDFELPQSYIEKGDTLEIKSAMCVPVISGSQLLGAIYIESIKPYGFRKKDQFLLNSLVGSLAVAIEKDRLSGKALSENSSPVKNKFFNIFKRK